MHLQRLPCSSKRGEFYDPDKRLRRSGGAGCVTACEENEILERHALGQPQPDPDAARHVIAQMERDVYERQP